MSKTPPVATPARTRSWDPLLVCTAVYILTAVARIHQLYRPLTALKPLILCAGLGLLLFLVDKSKVRSARQLKDPTSKAALFIAIWASVGLWFGIYRTNSIFYLREEVFPVMALFLLIAASVRDLGDVRRLLYIYAGGIVYLALSAMARKHGGMRLGGASYDANDLGMVLVSALSIGIYALTRARNSKSKLFAIVSLVVLAIATVETDSRGAFLALMGVIIYTLFFMQGVKKSWRLGAAAGVVVLMLYAATGAYWERMRTIFAPGDDYNQTSLTGRKKVWKRGMGYMMAYPIFGVGVDNFASAEGRSDIIQSRLAEGKGTKWSVAHSSWVQIGAEMGIPGLVALIIFYLGAIKRLRRLIQLARARDAPAYLKDGGAMAAALIGVLIGLMVAGSFVTQAFGYAVYAAAGLVAGLLKVMYVHGIDTGGRPARRGAVRPAMVPAAPGGRR